MALGVKGFEAFEFPRFAVMGDVALLSAATTRRRRDGSHRPSRHPRHRPSRHPLSRSQDTTRHPLHPFRRRRLKSRARSTGGSTRLVPRATTTTTPSTADRVRKAFRRRVSVCAIRATREMLKGAAGRSHEAQPERLREAAAGASARRLVSRRFTRAKITRGLSRLHGRHRRYRGGDHRRCARGLVRLAPRRATKASAARLGAFRQVLS
jgi:hypothetical protein